MRTNLEWVDFSAQVGLAFLAVNAASTRDVERYGHNVSNFDTVHTNTGLHHLPGLLVAEHRTRSDARAAAVPEHKRVNSYNVLSREPVKRCACCRWCGWID